MWREDKHKFLHAKLEKFKEAQKAARDEAFEDDVWVGTWAWTWDVWCERSMWHRSAGERGGQVACVRREGAGRIEEGRPVHAHTHVVGVVVGLGVSEPPEPGSREGTWNEVIDF